jgi:hypothetical protein
MDAMKNTLRFILIAFLCGGSTAKAQVVNVNTATQLQNALNAAQPGQIIQIADGYYERSGGFYANAGIDGTAATPITVIGRRNAILSTGIITTGYAFSLKGNKYWIIKGFTVTGSKNGCVIDSSKYITIDSICAKKVGQDGIHLRTYSSYCIVKNCYIDSTGLNDYSYGEGIYIGSAYSNWCTYTDCNPDTSNYNQILNNSFGDFVTAENIDIKEGTKYGIVRGNTFNGTGLQGMNGGDSWIDAKGNYYTIENNIGNNSILDGFQTHIAQSGWGNYNTFQNNILNVNGPGYGIRVQTSNSNGTAIGNVVCSSNTSTGAALGLTNVTTQTCSPLSVQLLKWNVAIKNNNLQFTWEVTDISDVAGFEIEESTDAIRYIKLLSAAASNTSYLKEIPLTGVRSKYFRLVILKKDGRKIFSDVFNLKMASGFKIINTDNAFLVYNPFSSLQAIFFDHNARLVKKFTLKNGYNEVELQQPLKGLFVMQVENGLTAKMLRL